MNKENGTLHTIRILEPIMTDIFFLISLFLHPFHSIFSKIKYRIQIISLKTSFNYGLAWSYYRIPKNYHSEFRKTNFRKTILFSENLFRFPKNYFYFRKSFFNSKILFRKDFRNFFSEYGIIVFWNSVITSC